MRFIALLLLATAGHTTIRAQQIGTTKPSALEFIGRQLDRGVPSKSATAVVGTPFTIAQWAPGRVLTTNGSVGPVWLKYNLASNQLLWRRAAGDSLELNTSQVNEFALGDSLKGSRTTYRRYLTARIEDLNLRTAFFEVCYDGGRSALLRQRTKQFTAGGGGSPSLTEGRPAAWQEVSQYFVKRADNIVLPVRLKEKAVLEALGSDHALELMAYTKREHLSLGKQADVAKLLRYYDTLP